MLKNFITTADLKTFYPNLQKEIWTEQADYQPQIDKAFDRLWNDLRNRQINPRLVCAPLDLFADAGSAANTPVKLKLFNGTTEGVPVRWTGQRRLVVECTSFTAEAEENTIEVYGSNVVEEPLTSSVTWSLVDTVTVAQAETVSHVLAQHYRWIYCRMAGDTSMVARVYLVDNAFDDLICYGAFKLIFGDIPEGFKKAEKDYDSLLQSVKFSYDDDEDDQPDESEEDTGRASVRFTR
jgi:hypothetical protein